MLKSCAFHYNSFSLQLLKIDGKLVSPSECKQMVIGGNFRLFSNGIMNRNVVKLTAL